ncbi:hypothetical protein LCGC14_1455080, partial [marine sediment metagenome]
SLIKDTARVKKAIRLLKEKRDNDTEFNQKVYDSLIVEKANFNKALKGDAGFDLFNATNETLTVAPYQSIQVNAGIRVKIPDGYCGLIRARSSTFFKKKLFVVSGLIDNGYTGPIFSFIWHPNLEHIDRPVLIKPWESLSQLIIVSSPILNVIEGIMPETVRGDRGFGSTRE